MNKLFDDLLIECAENNYKKGYQKAKKEILLMCAKNELKFLEEFNEFYKLSKEHVISQRISQLQDVIKKLEEMK